MNIALWILASLLAAVFLAAGMAKVATDPAKLAEKMSWVTSASPTQVRAVGAVEVLGAVGLVLPAAVDIAPVLVPLAATGLVLTMIGAVVVHLRLREGLAVAAPAIVLGVLAAVVALGRFGPYAF